MNLDSPRRGRKHVAGGVSPRYTGQQGSLAPEGRQKRCVTACRPVGARANIRIPTGGSRPRLFTDAPHGASCQRQQLILLDALSDCFTTRVPRLACKPCCRDWGQCTAGQASRGTPLIVYAVTRGVVKQSLSDLASCFPASERCGVVVERPPRRMEVIDRRSVVLEPADGEHAHDQHSGLE